MERKIIHFDQGDVLKHERTPEGFLRCFMNVSKVGDLVYRNADGSTRTEHLSRAELFNKDSYDTLKGQPVTFEHPPSLLTAETASPYVKGAVMPQVVIDSDFLGITSVIYDKATIDAIVSGKARDVSCGYTCKLRKRTDGVYEQYDRVYNHVAVTARGRAGESVGVHMDSIPSQNVWTQIRGDSMSDKTYQIDFPNGGVAHVDSDVYQLIKQERLDAKKKMKAMMSAMSDEGMEDEDDMDYDEDMGKTVAKKDKKKCDSDDDFSRADSLDSDLLNALIEKRLDAAKAKAMDMPEDEEEEDDDEEEMKRKDAADVLNTWIAISSELEPALIRGDAFVDGIEIEDGKLRFDSVDATALKESYINLVGYSEILKGDARFDSKSIDTVFHTAIKAREFVASNQNRQTLDTTLRSERKDSSDARAESLRADKEAGRKRINS